MIITIVEDHETTEEDDQGVVTTRYTSTHVFRFEFDDEWSYKETLNELSSHPWCLDAQRLQGKPLPA